MAQADRHAGRRQRRQANRKLDFPAQRIDHRHPVSGCRRAREQQADGQALGVGCGHVDPGQRSPERPAAVKQLLDLAVEVLDSITGRLDLVDGLQQRSHRRPTLEPRQPPDQDADPVDIIEFNETRSTESFHSIGSVGFDRTGVAAFAFIAAVAAAKRSFLTCVMTAGQSFFGRPR